MLDLTPAKSDLDPIEIASRDEIAALQLGRLKQTLRHAYENVPCYRAKFDAAGVDPDDCRNLSDLRPELILVRPAYMLAIVDEFRTARADPRACSLQVGIFGAEPWTNAMRAEIEESFNMHAVDIYGLSEVIGPGVACECVETKD